MAEKKYVPFTASASNRNGGVPLPSENWVGSSFFKSRGQIGDIAVKGEGRTLLLLRLRLLAVRFMKSVLCRCPARNEPEDDSLVKSLSSV